MKDIYLPFKSEKNELKNCNALKIQLRFEYGGTNYFTGDINKKGLYLHFQPIEKTETETANIEIHHYALFSGMKLLMKEMPRKNAKMEKIAEIHVRTNLDKIVELYLKEDYNALLSLCTL